MLNWLLGLVPAAKIPEAMRRVLENEKILFLEEDLCLTITFRGYRSPGRYFGWKRLWRRGSLALSSKRIMAFNWNAKFVNVPFNDPLIENLTVRVDEKGRFCIRFDASDFHEDASGEIECHFKTDDANKILSIFEARKDACRVRA